MMIGPSLRIYVANPNGLNVANPTGDFTGVNGMVSVIDRTKNNTVIQNISIGSNPKYIYPQWNLIYVANIEEPDKVGYVSRINMTDNTVIQNVSVGIDPTYIFGDPSSSDALHVANAGSGGIAVINTVKNETVAGVTFDVSPSRTGNILCNADSNPLDVPINRLFYVSSGTECVAKPGKGFEFNSWEENLDGNSTRTVSTSTQSDPLWRSILDSLNIKLNDPASPQPLTAFLDFMNITLDDPSATMTINQFGNFTASFRKLPPPLPTEYWATLFTVVITALIGSLLIPAVIGWTNQNGKLLD